MLNTAIDFDKVVKEYNSEGLTIVDKFLDINTIKSIRDFSLYSGIIQEQRQGYYAIDFNRSELWTPELEGIVSELAEKMPSICASFLRAWSFVYDQQCEGVSIHADPVNTNLNLWVTPDDCISDFRRNGLIIWKSKPPKGWVYEDYNTSNEDCRNRIYEFLKNNNAEEVSIKYKFNRAIFFNSQLFHKTNGVLTRPGKANARVNYTFLFGEDLVEKE